jgi:pimeloyl-ACP methyl ester carboxylesterase
MDGVGETSFGGECLCDVGRGITLCYETIGDPADPPLLLVMGLGMQMIGWQDELCAELAGRGFHVVRFDNRDAGRSTSIDAPVPALRQLATRRFDRRQYSLADMADDTAGLLRELDLAPAHVLGASLGGMVAQTLAARHRGSVRTLTSLMSTTGSRLRGQPAFGVLRTLLSAAPRERDAFVDHAVKVFKMIGSPAFPPDEADIRARAERSYDRGLNPAGTARQLGAIVKSGDRTRELRSVRAPTLVIHGDADRVIAPSGGRATARAIPGARLQVVEGMGHDLPRGAWPLIVDAVDEHAHPHERATVPA